MKQLGLAAELLDAVGVSPDAGASASSSYRAPSTAASMWFWPSHQVGAGGWSLHSFSPDLASLRRTHIHIHTFEHQQTKDRVLSLLAACPLLRAMAVLREEAEAGVSERVSTIPHACVRPSIHFRAHICPWSCMPHDDKRLRPSVPSLLPTLPQEHALHTPPHHHLPINKQAQGSAGAASTSPEDDAYELAHRDVGRALARYVRCFF